MVSFGRVCCVGLPFVLAVASIVALLVAGLAGVTDKNMYIFKVNTTDLSISADSALSILTKRMADLGGYDARSVVDTRTSAVTAKDTSSTNITASEIGLGDAYLVSLWGYCEISSSGTRNCTKAQFDWAHKVFNSSESSLTSLGTSYGVNITLPTEVTKALKAFATLSKWTEVVFLVAFGSLALEIVFGLFTSCSRGVSCLTFLVAGVSGIVVIAAAAMATAMGVVVVAALDASAKEYGVTAHLHTGFLAAVWIAAAFALGASFFWMFTVCCCKPDSRSRSGGSRHLDDKSAPRPGSYQPLNDPRQSGYYNSAAYAPQYGMQRQPGRSDLAYEPYSHSRV